MAVRQLKCYVSWVKTVNHLTLRYRVGDDVLGARHSLRRLSRVSGIEKINYIGEARIFTTLRMLGNTEGSFVNFIEEKGVRE